MRAEHTPTLWLPLRYAVDLRTLMFLSLLTAVMAVQWSNVSRSGWLLLPTYLLAFIAVVVKHNHMHSPTFRSTAWNSLFEFWLSLVTGQPSTGIITVHNELHHGHNNEEVDFVRCSLVRHRWNWLNLLTFPFVSVWAMYRGKSNDLAKWRLQRPSLYRQALLERVVTYAFVGALLWSDWHSTLKYCFGPWLFAQWAIVAINLLQHQDCDLGSDFDHSRNLTGSVLNWFLLNNGYHTAHHAFPAAHWSSLPAIHRKVIAPRMRTALNQRSLVGCLWRRFITGQDWSGSRA